MVRAVHALAPGGGVLGQGDPGRVTEHDLRVSQRDGGEEGRRVVGAEHPPAPVQVVGGEPARALEVAGRAQEVRQVGSRAQGRRVAGSEDRPATVVGVLGEPPGQVDLTEPGEGVGEVGSGQQGGGAVGAQGRRSVLIARRSSMAA